MDINSKIQIATVAAVASAAATASTILAYQHLRKGEGLENEKGLENGKGFKNGKGFENGKGLEPREQLIPDAPADLIAWQNSEDKINQRCTQRAQRGEYDEELILEQLARNRVFLGDEGLDKLRNAFVIVVGCGGVGSHAVTALARSGVSRLRLIDFDQVTLSSLNRHAVATLADVGISKVECLKRRLLPITPWVRLDLRVQKFDASVANPLLAPWQIGPAPANGQRPDFVIDAIDNIASKVELLKYCHDHGIPVISSMGAGTKGDPTKVMVGDISESTDDGLSRATRRKLKVLGVSTGIDVAYSTEKMAEGKASLLPISDEEYNKGSVGDLGPLPDFRVRILPVLGTMPAVFGYTVANHVILKITEYPIEYGAGKARYKLYDSTIAFIQSNEQKLVRLRHGHDAGDGLRIPLTQGDIEFLIEEAYRGRSVVSGIPTRLVLVRWKKPSHDTLRQVDKQKSAILEPQDLVCMTKDEATKHTLEVLLGSTTVETLWGPEICDKVDKTVNKIQWHANRYWQGL